VNWLHLQGRTPLLPHTIVLADGAKLQLNAWLRVLPDQRYVARAQWQGKTVLAKLFIGKKAKKHYQQELQGIQNLITQRLPTPAVVESHSTEQHSYLLFDYLENNQSLAEQWAALEQASDKLSPQQIDLLQQALRLIAQMHKQGLWQSDLHLDNFLQQEQTLYIIDGGSIQHQQLGKPINKKAIINNLAIFFAQLPRIAVSDIDELLSYYQQHNTSHKLSADALTKPIEKIRQWRLKDYLKKTARDCSLFSVQKNAHGIKAFQRELQTTLQPIIDSPDSFISQGQMYKAGGSATVARIHWQNRDWIIKRYNIKNLKHWFKRCWRPSRAWHSWQSAHRLQLLGIPAIAVHAVREERIFGLRKRAWLVSSYCGEQDIIDRFAAYVDNGQVPEQELHSLIRLLRLMKAEKISHGDLKGHNIFWHNGQFVLIDLDAVKHHRGNKTYAKAFKKDRARLLRNWPKESALYRLLDKNLPQIN